MTAYYQNVRGLNSKISAIYNQLISTHYDIIACSETWLKPDTCSSQIFGPDFVTFRSDRVNKQGGGVCLAIKDSNRFRIHTIDTSNLKVACSSIDVVGVEIKTMAWTLTVILVYIPPHVNSNEHLHFLEELSNIIIAKQNILLLGDFNVRGFVNNDFSNRRCREVIDFFKYLDLVQVNTIRNTDNVLLDLVGVRAVECKVVRDPMPIKKEDIYHPALSIDLNLTVPSGYDFPSITHAHSYNYRKANWNAIHNGISRANWSIIEESCDVDDMCNKFYDILYNIIDKHIPKRQPRKKKISGMVQFRYYKIAEGKV